MRGFESCRRRLSHQAGPAPFGQEVGNGCDWASAAGQAGLRLRAFLPRAGGAALARAGHRGGDSGRLRWRRTFDRPSVGPNGVAYGWGLLFAATDTSILALDPRTGQTVWSRVLVRNNHEGIDIAPQLYDGTVVVSTVAGNLNTVSSAGAMGIVWALDAQTGEPKWQFNTVKDGDLWGNPEINSGGGLWYPPAVDGSGRVFLAVANPVPF